MVRVDIEYIGGLRCRAVHGPSAAELETDAPADNQGRGEAFSPTDLVGTALATCMLTIMGIVAEREGIALEGARASVTKEMHSSPRRIARLAVSFHIATPVTDVQKQKLRNAALTCPVHRSLHPDIDVPIEFRWEQALPNSPE